MQITQEWLAESAKHLDELEERAKLDHVLNMGKIAGAREQLAGVGKQIEAEEKKAEEAPTGKPIPIEPRK